MGTAALLSVVNPPTGRKRTAREPDQRTTAAKTLAVRVHLKVAATMERARDPHRGRAVGADVIDSHTTTLAFGPAFAARVQPNYQETPPQGQPGNGVLKHLADLWASPSLARHAARPKVWRLYRIERPWPSREFGRIALPSPQVQ
jgi:hypothetical protein